MQINGITTSAAIPVERTTPSSPTVNSTSDQAVLNTSADSFSSLVQAAGQVPEVRSEVVDAFKTRVQAGHYPAQDVIAGLTRLIGGGVMQHVKAGSSQKA